MDQRYRRKGKLVLPSRDSDLGREGNDYNHSSGPDRVYFISRRNVSTQINRIEPKEIVVLNI